MELGLHGFSGRALSTQTDGLVLRPAGDPYSDRRRLDASAGGFEHHSDLAKAVTGVVNRNGAPTRLVETELAGVRAADGDTSNGQWDIAQIQHVDDMTRAPGAHGLIAEADGGGVHCEKGASALATQLRRQRAGIGLHVERGRFDSDTRRLEHHFDFAGRTDSERGAAVRCKAELQRILTGKPDVLD